MYVCFINAFTKLRIDTLLQKNLMLKNRLSKIQLWQFLETSYGYAMNFKPRKARERFKDKGMIYFRNKEQCFKCDGLLDWHHSATKGHWSSKTDNFFNSF